MTVLQAVEPKSATPVGPAGGPETLFPTPGAPGLGYVLAGRRPGPTLVVADPGNGAADLARRLSRVPTLPWMRGRIVILRLDAIPAAAGATLSDQIGPVDRVLHLPLAGSAEQAYWTVLRMAARLGMIAGRGLPN